MQGKDVKRLTLVPPNDWKTRGMCLVLAWEFLEANRCEIPFIFLQISVAIDLHEESRFIAEGIFTNSITQPCLFMLYYTKARVMGSSCIKIACFVGLGHWFYQGARLILRGPKIGTKMDELVGFGHQGAVQTSIQVLRTLFTYRPRRIYGSLL